MIEFIAINKNTSNDRATKYQNEIISYIISGCGCGGGGGVVGDDTMMNTSGFVIHTIRKRRGLGRCTDLHRGTEATTTTTMKKKMRFVRSLIILLH